MGGKPLLLLVDDNSKNLEVLGNCLSIRGYQLGFAMNGKEALDFLQADKPVLILLDIMMPEMDGFETAEKISTNTQTKHIPIIFLTSKVDQDSIMQGFEVGGVDYITKPFVLNELIARVSLHVKLSLQRQQLHNLLHKKSQKLDTTYNFLLQSLQDIKQFSVEPDRMIDFFSHILKTPLTTIIGFSSELARELKDMPEHAVLADTVIQESFRLSKIVQELIDLLEDTYQITIKK